MRTADELRPGRAHLLQSHEPDVQALHARLQRLGVAMMVGSQAGDGVVQVAGLAGKVAQEGGDRLPRAADALDLLGPPRGLG
jgi:hypothetical protein